jgi:hypothetical protein
MFEHAGAGAGMCLGKGAVVAALLVAAVGAGCGSAAGPATLTAAERAQVADAEASLSELTLNSAEPGHARTTERRLLALCDRKASADYDQRTVAEVAAEIADDLAAHTYEAMAQQLRDHCLHQERQS